MGVEFVKTFWERTAERDLQEYGIVKDNLDGMREEIRMLKERLESPKSAGFGKIPVQGGGSTYEDRLVDDLCRMGLLRENLERREAECQCVERVLSQLSDEDMRVIQYLCIDGKKPVDYASEYSYSVQWVYALKDRAMRNFCLARYGDY